MRDVVHYVEARDVLLVEKVNGLGFLLAVDGNQDIGTRHLFLARRLYVEYRALQDPLEPEGRLRFPSIVTRKQGRGFLEEVSEVALEAIDVSPTCPQNFDRCRIVEQREQQMLDGHELVFLVLRLFKGQVESEF